MKTYFKYILFSKYALIYYAILLTMLCVNYYFISSLSHLDEIMTYVSAGITVASIGIYTYYIFNRIDKNNSILELTYHYFFPKVRFKLIYMNKLWLVVYNDVLGHSNHYRIISIDKVVYTNLTREISPDEAKRCIDKQYQVEYEILEGKREKKLEKKNLKKESSIINLDKL